MPGRIALMVATTLAFGAPYLQSGEQPEEKPILVVYPFEVSGTAKSTAERMANLFTRKAEKTGRFTVFADVDRDAILAEYPLTPALDTPAEKVAEHARTRFRARLALWGRFVKLRDTLDSPCELFVKAVRIDPDGVHVALDRKWSLDTVNGASDKAVEVVADLAGIQRVETMGVAFVRDLTPNLLSNGDFSKPATRGVGPAGWDELPRSFPADQVSWADVGGAHGKCLKYTLNAEIADTYGMMMYSEPIPVDPKKFYVVRLDVDTRGPSVILFVKGYGEGKTSGERVVLSKYQKRFYNPEGKKGFVPMVTRPFRPYHPTGRVVEMKVELYAYHPAGEVFFDNVEVKEVEVSGRDLTEESAKRAFHDKGRRDAEFEGFAPAEENDGPEKPAESKP